MRLHISYKHLTTIILMLVSMCFIQSYAFDSTVNLAIGKPAIARESRAFEGYGINPSFVTDNNMTSHWCAEIDGTGKGSWIYIDLQNYYMVNKVTIDWRANRWPNGAWKLQVATNEPDASGNSNWVDVYTGNAGTDVVNGLGTYTFTATTGRYVRMLGVAQSNGYGYNIFEMRAFAEDFATPQGGANSFAVSPPNKTLMVNQPIQFQSAIWALNGVPMNVVYTPTWSASPTTGTIINETTGLFRATQTGTFTVNCNTTYESTPYSASATVTVIPFNTTLNLALNKATTTSGETASNGNDGSLTTRWRSNNGNQKEWWQVDLGTDYVINNVIIKMDGDGGARGATYNILASLTGLEGSWETVVSTATIPAGSGTEFNSHTFAAVPARYIKYDGITKGRWDHNFAEFEVRGTGFYQVSALSEFTSILFNEANVIESEEVALSIATLDAESSPYLNASITGIEVTTGNAAGVTFEKRNSVWYATGLTQGVYTLTATGVDNANGAIVKTGTATLTVTEARRVATITLTKPLAITKYAANRAYDLTVSSVDQYGAPITPTYVWDIQGAAGGSVNSAIYTPANIGTGNVKATVTTTAGLVESQALVFDVITNAQNIGLNKPVSSISTATTNGSHAVDASLGTQWIVPYVTTGNFVYDAWLIIDLQAYYNIELVDVIWEGAYSKTFTIDYSTNGVDFTTKYNGSNSGAVETKYNQFYTNPTTARYVRIFSTEAGTNYNTKLLDVYIHAKPVTITVSSNTNLSTSTFTPEELANSDVLITSNELIVDQNAIIKAIIVQPGAKLTLDAGKTLTATTLNLQSDATGTATFVDNGTATITSATVQQYLSSGRNWYMSSPIAGATVPAGLTYYSYDETGSNQNSVLPATAYWVAENQGASINPMKGYITQPIEATTKSFVGTLNTGTKTIALTRTTSASKPGFNLVANPYPSYLDWSLVDTTASNILSSVWYRTKTIGGSYTFDTYNGGLNISTTNGANAVSKLIPPMQGFWVRVKSGYANGTLTFTNAMRKHIDIPNNIFKAPAIYETKLIRLRVSNGINADETIICYNENTTNGLDSYDSPKMFNNANNIPEIYTQIGSEKLVINGMKTVKYNTEIPLGFATGENNSFSISNIEMNNFETGTKIILQDKLLNLEADLTDNRTYNFSSDKSAASLNRFSLILRSPSITTNLLNTTNIRSHAYVNADNQIVIVSDKNSSFTIFNAMGQQVLNDKTGSYNTFVVSGITKSGLYIVKVSDKNTASTSKLIIK